MEERVQVCLDRIPELFLTFCGWVCVGVRSEEGGNIAVPCEARVEPFGLADAFDDSSAVEGVCQECEIDQGWSERVGGINCYGSAYNLR